MLRRRRLLPTDRERIESDLERSYGPTRTNIDPYAVQLQGTMSVGLIDSSVLRAVALVLSLKGVPPDGSFGHFLDLVQENWRSQEAKSRAKQVRRGVLEQAYLCSLEHDVNVRTADIIAIDVASFCIADLARLSGAEEGIVRAGVPMERYRWQRRGVRR